MRVLIVEDEQKVAAFLRQGLEEEGWIVHIAPEGREGWHKIQTGTYDVIVLDIMLPGIDGLTILKSMREAGIGTPTILLTAKDTVPDKVKGLHMGADDYLVKPFAFEELLARLYVLTRKRHAATDELLQAGDLRLYPLKHEVYKRGKKIELTAMEFRLLELLMRNGGQVVSRLDIEELVWDKNFDRNTNVVDVYINYLRKKVDKPFGSQLIKTVRGFGYKIEE